MKKRIVSILLYLCIVAVGILPMFAVEAEAATNTGNVTWNQSAHTTENLIPQLEVGEDLAAAGWGGLNDQIAPTAQKIDNSSYTGGVIRALNTSNDIGTAEHTGGVYYTIELSDTDKLRA